jgi:hypothetical protein
MWVKKKTGSDHLSFTLLHANRLLCHEKKKPQIITTTHRQTMTTRNFRYGNWDRNLYDGKMAQIVKVPLICPHAKKYKKRHGYLASHPLYLDIICWIQLSIGYHKFIQLSVIKTPYIWNIVDKYYYFVIKNKWREFWMYPSGIENKMDDWAVATSESYRTLVI